MDPPSRRDRIRTCDLKLPKQTRYHTAPLVYATIVDFELAPRLEVRRTAIPPSEELNPLLSCVSGIPWLPSLLALDGPYTYQCIP
jgi:hypothetical protein